VTEWSRLVRASVHGLQAYQPGPSLAELEERHGGAVVRLDRNEDLFPPIPGMREAVEAELGNVWRYPDESYGEFRTAVASEVGTTSDRIVPAHGIQTLIGILASLLLDPGDSVVVAHPSYGLYAQASAARGATVLRVPLRDLSIDFEAVAAAADESSAKVVWICDPNNPTGSLAARDDWEAFLDALPDGCVVVADEAYADYVEPQWRLGRELDVEAGRPVVVLRTLSKLYGIAGLRLGYAVADPELAHYLDVIQEPFNVNRAALAAGLVCIARPELIEERRQAVADAREHLLDLLRRGGLEPRPSHTNFVLVETGVDGATLAAAVAEEGLLLRPGGEWGLDEYVRITVGPVPLMERAAEAVGRARRRALDGVLGLPI
jgi:histidinol-phosphate aminotransferase